MKYVERNDMIHMDENKREVTVRVVVLGKMTTEGSSRSQYHSPYSLLSLILGNACQEGHVTTLGPRVVMLNIAPAKLYSSWSVNEKIMIASRH